MTRNVFTNPRLEGTKGWVEIRRNLCRNPSFEESTIHWTGGGSGAQTHRVASPMTNGSGGWALSFFGPTGTGYIDARYAPPAGQRIAVTPGQWVGVEATVKKDSGQTLRFASTGIGESALHTIQGEARLRWVTSIPAEVTEVQMMQIVINSSVSNPTEADPLFIDAVNIQVGSTEAEVTAALDRGYFDGSTPLPHPGMRARWVGAENASESVMESFGRWVEVSANYAIDAGSRGAANFMFGGWVGSGGNASTVKGVDATWAHTGRAMRQEWSAVTEPNSGDIGFRFTRGIKDPYRTLQPGEVWTAQAKLRASRTGIEAAPLFRFPSPGGMTVLAQSHDTPIVMTAGQIYTIWITVRIDDPTLITDDTRAVCHIRSKQAGDYVEIADGDVYPGAYDPNRAFFWGGSEDFSIDPDMRTRFVGTEYFTPSVLEGELVEGFLPYSGALIVSERDGERAGRLISLTNLGSAETVFLLPEVGEYTALATFHYGEAIGRPTIALVSDTGFATDEATEPGATVRAKLDQASMGGLIGAVSQGGKPVDAWVTAFGIYEGEYDGPPADGDTPGWEWEGEPGNSPSRTRQIDPPATIPDDTVSEWDGIGERYFQGGVSKGMLYGSDFGVPWNGLVSVNEKRPDVEIDPQYQNGLKVNQRATRGEFGLTIQCFATPDEFDRYIGEKTLGRGFYVSNQDREEFHFSYVTKIGNDLEGEDAAYRLHLVYNAMAVESDRQYTTKTTSLAPTTFSYDISTRAVEYPGLSPIAHLYFDSHKTSKGFLYALEKILYGTSSQDPRMPTIDELFTLGLNGGGVSNLFSNPDFSTESSSITTVSENFITNPEFLADPGHGWLIDEGSATWVDTGRSGSRTRAYMTSNQGVSDHFDIRIPTSIPRAGSDAYLIFDVRVDEDVKPTLSVKLGASDFFLPSLENSNGWVTYRVKLPNLWVSATPRIRVKGLGGSIFRIRRPKLAYDVFPYYDPTTPKYDSDLTVLQHGVIGQSMSSLFGRRPTGLSLIDNVACVISTQMPGYDTSLRVINTMDDQDAYVRLQLHTSPLGLRYIFEAYRELEEVLGTVSIRSTTNNQSVSIFDAVDQPKAYSKKYYRKDADPLRTNVHLALKPGNKPGSSMWYSGVTITQAPLNYQGPPILGSIL